MTINPVRNARWLLDQLEDPFTMFPVEGVADTLFEAVDEAETRKNGAHGSLGCSKEVLVG